MLTSQWGNKCHQPAHWGLSAGIVDELINEFTTKGNFTSL